jgi:hypothetical protein
MNAPMILPWLARKWSVSEARTLALWNEACFDADHVVGETRNSAYWNHARARWIDLLDQEVIARFPATETPWIMIRLNLLRLLASVRMWFVGHGFASAY